MTLRTAELMSTLTSSLGFIHRFVPASERGLPTLLLLHGTGGLETDLLPLGSQLAPGAAMLSPRGKVLENAMPRFFRRLAQGIFDLRDLRLRTHELADFVEAASRTYNFEPRRLIALGYSNGANIAASMLLLHPHLLAGAILLRPMLPFIPNSIPNLTGIPVLISAGRLDQLVDKEETERLLALLQETRATVTLHWQTTGHQLTQEDIEAGREWLLKNASVLR